MTGKEEDAVKIKVPAQDPDNGEDDVEPKHPEQPLVDMEDGDDDTSATDKKMTKEDIMLKELLESAVDKLTSSTSTLSTRISAVETLSHEIRRATSSMTSVPKPFKFLRNYYADIKSFYQTLEVNSLKMLVADVLSVLGMTMGAEGKRECLFFKLAGNRLDIAPWGHEFVRALAGEISQEFVQRKTSTSPKPTEDLIDLVDVIVPFQMSHSVETEAVDLLLEVNELEKIVPYVDKSNFSRVCLYLLRFGEFLIALEDLEVVMGVAFKLYLKVHAFPDALRVAMRVNDLKMVEEAMKLAKDTGDKALYHQMALMLGGSRYFAFMDEEDETAKGLISNESIWEQFQNLARELNVEEAKKPEDVYKSHLSETNSLASEAAPVQSAQQNLANTFVNAFVNCGFQKDALMTESDEHWLYRNKEEGIISASASLGMILLWNVNEGMSQIDQYLYHSGYVRAGALLALGIVNCGVRDEIDPALGLLSEHLERDKPSTNRLTAALGLGLAYAGNPKEDVADALMPVIADSGESSNMEVVSIAGLALSIAFAGTANEDVCMTIVQRLMEATKEELDQPVSQLLCIGLGLLFIGKQDKADATIEVVKTVEHRVAKFAEVVIETCAYTGSGNVFQVQKLMHMCAKHANKNGEFVDEEDSDKEDDEKEKSAEADKDTGGSAQAKNSNSSSINEGEAEQSEDEKMAEKDQAAKNAIHQSAAVIGIALITFGESVGRDMAQRTFQHLLQYGDLAVRRAVPLAMALSHVSDPDYAIIDILSKLTHDGDRATAMSAIFSLGLIASGTNNSRVAQMLRGLASFYSKEADPLFVVRLAQGLLHASKGLVTLAPYHSDRTLLSVPAVAGILSVLYCCLDFKSILLGKHHYLMFCLACAIRPRMLMTLDAETMEPVPVKVRVGEAVETVGLAGKPKSITGFQTHSTPVLLSHNDRAELASAKYEPLTSVLEGIVLLRKTKEGEEDAQSN